MASETISALQNASQLKGAPLYNYQPYNKEWLNNIITTNLIYLSNPSSFNDPWDCRPCFNVQLEDPMVRRSHIEYYIAAHERSFPDRKEIREEQRKVLEKSPEKLKELIAKTSAGIGDDIVKNYRVYCLTTKNDNSLMWSHYASKHSGICLEFDTKNEVFSTAYKVEYRAEYPSFQLANDSTEENVRILTTKSDVWSYEDEYRLIALEKGSSLPKRGVLISNNNFMEIPAAALKSIIIGAEMTDKLRTEIYATVKASGNKIHLKQATRLPNKYGLLIESI